MKETALDKPWWTLRLTYGLVPIIAGLDKFTNLLTDWTKYLSPLATKVIPVSPPTFMHGVGIVEIAAGALVLDKRTTRFGGYLVSAWLAGIGINLLTTGKYFDVAVRDLVMAVGAFTYAKLTEIRAQQELPAKAEKRRDERIGPVAHPAS
ncbi:MAG: DoxX family membrane protein [Kofleriaceae bacterium]|nr:DoxX family membrane protein [Kofleriaceae bacterium]